MNVISSTKLALDAQIKRSRNKLSLLSQQLQFVHMFVPCSKYSMNFDWILKFSVLRNGTSDWLCQYRNAPDVGSYSWNFVQAFLNSNRVMVQWVEVALKIGTEDSIAQNPKNLIKSAVITQIFGLPFSNWVNQ